MRSSIGKSGERFDERAEWDGFIVILPTTRQQHPRIRVQQEIRDSAPREFVLQYLDGRLRKKSARRIDGGRLSGTARERAWESRKKQKQADSETV